MVVGENGVLSRATNAATETSQAETKQELESALMDAQTDFATTTWKDDNSKSFFPDYLNTKSTLTSTEYTITLNDDYVANSKEYITGTILKTGGSTTYEFKVVPKGQMGAKVDEFKVKTT